MLIRRSPSARRRPTPRSASSRSRPFYASADTSISSRSTVRAAPLRSFTRFIMPFRIWNGRSGCGIESSTTGRSSAGILSASTPFIRWLTRRFFWSPPAWFSAAKPSIENEPGPDIVFAAHRAAGFLFRPRRRVWRRNFKPWKTAATNRIIFSACCSATASRIFANSSFVEADAYYHSGYYPTIFDNKSAFQTPHIAEDTGAVASHNQGEETVFWGRRATGLTPLAAISFPTATRIWTRAARRMT